VGVDDDIARALIARDGELARLREQNSRLRALLEEAHCAVSMVLMSCMEHGQQEGVEAWADLWKRVQEGLTHEDLP